MSYTKRFSVIMAIMTLLVGVCGCMFERSHEDIINNMLRITSQKYDRSFTEEYFTAAKDSTHSNILTLSLDGCLFNVYQRGDDQNVWDDLIQVAASKKATNYLLGKIGGLPNMTELYCNFLFSDLDTYTYEDITKVSVDELLSSSQLIKIITVVKTSEPLTECKDRLFAIYKAILSFDPEYIDFEVIYCQEDDAILAQMLNNLSGFFDSDWNKQKTVLDSISVLDKTRSSPYELIQR